MVTLNELQCVYLRELLFEELHETAGILAEQAHAAAEGNAEQDNIAGDDALGTWRNRLQVAAELLDTIGWSVRTDMAKIVELERKRRSAGAA
jgi:hypothetical protein